VRSLLAERQGLTLVEVLSALVVLSIGLVATISMLPLASSGVHEGSFRSRAALLALARIEEIRHAVGRAGAEGDPVSEGLIQFPDEPTLAPPHTMFSRMVRITDCGVEPGCSGGRTPGLRQVTVTVTYPAISISMVGPRRRAAVVLNTYIGPR
jgi:prepilin-type N-terminal cleavage/methylation domain-containing protein